MGEQVLLIGSGGREHALAWKLAQSEQVSHIYCAPGNGGTEIQKKCQNISIKPDDIEAILDWLKTNTVDLVVVGPELPLSLGLVDEVQKLNIPVFGPIKHAAQLETSKVYAKRFMQQNNLPTAKFEVFTNQQAAYDFCKNNDWARVLKLDGLAGGKGVYVCETLSDCETALTALYASDSETTVLLEEKLTGPEASLFLICDGKTIMPLQLAQDYKRRFDKDKGPNTGGMGSYSPVDWVVPYQDCIQKDIITPIEIALAKLSHKFCGLLFVGLLFHNENPYILEFNARFGDPETQSILPGLECDFYELLFQAATHNLEQYLEEARPYFNQNSHVCVNIIHNEYPVKSSTGNPIVISTLPENTVVFQAGTQYKNGQLETNGGRILNVVSSGSTKEEAISLAYKAIKQISFEQMDYRTDIGTTYGVATTKEFLNV